jgi:radical SAM protein with 4Fe4S-binding SPASM domain
MFLQLHITKDCNLRCAHCYESADYFPDEAELTTQECKAIIHEFASFAILNRRPGIVYLTGGEPMLREDVCELLETCGQYSLATRLLTNGTLIDASSARRLRACGTTSVQVSIDGLEATHDRLRGAGAYSDAVRGVDSLVSAGVPVTVMTTAGRNNAAELEPLWTEMVAHGAKRLAFGRLVPTGRGGGLGDMVLSPAECAGLFRSALEFERTHGAEVVKRDPLWRVFDHQCYPGCTTTGCSIGINGLCILHDGTVLPCRRLPVPIGSIQKESIHSIWTKSPVLAVLRERNLEGSCGTCPLRTKCGGCRGVAYAVSGNYLAQDPQCFRSAVSPGTS